MKDDYKSFYSDARLYDLVSGAYAAGDFLEFYRRQVTRYGEPVLELACGSGRLTIPLAEAGFDVTGLDISAEMLELARSKAAERGVELPLVRGDVRDFELGEKFKLIFIPAQSLTHLAGREEIEACFSCVRRHLAEDGRFLVELFNPSVELLARDPGRRHAVGEYRDADGGGRVVVAEESRYDAATQVKHIRWFFRTEGRAEETALSFEMRQFFPREIDALLWYNGLSVEHKYGSYAEEEFTGDSPKQLIVCRPR